MERELKKSSLWILVIFCAKLKDLKWWITAQEGFKSANLASCNHAQTVWPECHLDLHLHAAHNSSFSFKERRHELHSKTFFFRCLNDSRSGPSGAQRNLYIYFLVPMTSETSSLNKVIWSFHLSSGFNLPGRLKGMWLLLCSKVWTNPGH